MFKILRLYIVKYLLVFFPKSKTLDEITIHNILKLLSIIFSIFCYFVMGYWIIVIYPDSWLRHAYDGLAQKISLIATILVTVVVSYLPSLLYVVLLLILQKHGAIKERYLKIDTFFLKKVISFLFLVLITIITLGFALNKTRNIEIKYTPMFEVKDYELKKNAYFKNNVDKSIVVENVPFYSGDKEVSAEGSWVSESVSLAEPIQTVKMTCRFDNHNCEIITAGVSDDGFFYVFKDNEIIEWWGYDQILTQPRETSGGCAKYFYRIDRQNYQVTSTRTTISQVGSCSALQNEQIIMTLKSGDDRIKEFNLKK